MYTMKETCVKTNLNYETLKFYCNEGLIPNIKRNKNNHRVFSKNNVEWIKNLSCLRDCGMTINEMKNYINLALEGESSINVRKEILKDKQLELEAKIAKMQASLNYINEKQKFYTQVQDGEVGYFSLLLAKDE